MFVWIGAIFFIVMGTCFSEESNIERNPLQLGAHWEFAHLIKGEDRKKGKEFEMEPFTRLGVALNQTATVGKRFEASIGVGGLFYYSWPPIQGGLWTIVTRFGPGITQATGTYQFGDVQSKNLYLQFGFFPVKYNRDAKNLGEYLFRSSLYPTITRTGSVGSWGIVNSADFVAQGVRLSWTALEGRVTNEFSLYMEKDNPPMFDLTPTYYFNFRPIRAIEFGAGISWHHAIPVIPSKLRPKHTNANRILIFNNFPEIPGDTTIEINENGQIVKTVDVPERPNGPIIMPFNTLDGFLDSNGVDIVNGSYYLDQFDVSQSLYEEDSINTFEKIWYDFDVNGDGLAEAVGTPIIESSIPDKSVTLSNGSNRYLGSDNNRYIWNSYIYTRTEKNMTHQGIKAIFKGAMDIKALFDYPDNWSVDDLRVYFELGILGFQNQTFFYENINNRMPIMFGINFPTFGWMDLISLELQYFDTYWDNCVEELEFEQMPIPCEENFLTYAPTTSDDWKWSLFFKKKMGNVNLYGQFASDHFRSVTSDNRPSWQPVVDRLDEWYYALRVEIGI